MHDTHPWVPFREFPTDLVRPVRLSADGSTGPTRSQARASYWHQVAQGWYVDARIASDSVEQRILGQAVRLGETGAVTAWAALRWRGAGFFDGTDQGGRRLLPVPLLMGAHGSLRRSAAAAISKEQFPPEEREVVNGIGCSVADRALFDEVRRRGTVRPAVAAADMTLAAGITTPESFAEYVARRPAWTGIGLVRKVLPLMDPRSASPQESLMRLTWVLDAGLPRPLCNPNLLTPDGGFLGRPDLLDPEVGLVGEYDGADHLQEDRRRRDRAREERFRDHGLEYVCVVRGELGQGARVAARIREAYRRAASIRRPQTWVLVR